VVSPVGAASNAAPIVCLFAPLWPHFGVNAIFPNLFETDSAPIADNAFARPKDPSIKSRKSAQPRHEANYMLRH
jgi:hypothetical protein